MPSWDGNPSKWSRYKKDLAIWLEGANVDVQFSWGARSARNLSGHAKLNAELIPLEELRQGERRWAAELDDRRWALGAPRHDVGDQPPRGHVVDDRYRGVVAQGAGARSCATPTRSSTGAEVKK